MTRLDTVDIDALAESLRADAKNSAAGIEQTAKAEARLLLERSEELIKNIRIAQDCHKLSEGMFSGAELACVAETDDLLGRFKAQDNLNPIKVQGVELLVNTNLGQYVVRFGNFHPNVRLPAGRYRFVLIGYRLPDADGKED